MGGLMAAISAGNIWGAVPQPHVKSHFDCECSNDSSSSEEAIGDDRKTTTWLERHRPLPEKVISTTSTYENTKSKHHH